MQQVASLLPVLLRNFRDLPALTLPVWRALWLANVGTALSTHTEVAQFRAGSLIVKVDHPAWYQQLLILKQDLISKLNEACGRKALFDIQFVCCPERSATPAADRNRVEAGDHLVA